MVGRGQKVSEAARLVRVRPFDFHGVTLEDGRMRRQFDEVRSFYLRIPTDDLLHGYRLRAGRLAPGKELGGWYTADAGNTLPQIISGLARMHAATGDHACVDKASALLEGWAECVAPDGYSFYSDHPTSRHYYYEKVVGALVDMARYAGSSDALRQIDRVTDWAIMNLDRTREYANAIGDRQDPRHLSGEWYTVSENLYRAYLQTGRAAYRDFAEVWEYPEYWEIFAEGRDVFGARRSGGKTLSYHAYSHVNTLASAAAAYLVRGDRWYLDAIRGAYDWLQRSQLYATGGYGPNEELLPHERFRRSLVDAPNHFEVQCGSWAAFKLCKYLICLTGEARYGDWIERLILNGIGADLPMAPDGRVLYYAHYHLGGSEKKLISSGWSCCTGSRPMAVADYHDLVWFRDDDGLYLNLFAPSTVRWNVGGQDVSVEQRTVFPAEGATQISVRSGQPVRFRLRIRRPSWLYAGMSARIGGVPVDGLARPDGWLEIDRTWSPGDRLDLSLPLGWREERLDDEPGAPAALMRGPVVFAFQGSPENPGSAVDFGEPDRSLSAVAGDPLNYRLRSDPAVLVRPFFEIAEGERYHLYLDQNLLRTAPAPSR